MVAAQDTWQQCFNQPPRPPSLYVGPAFGAFYGCGRWQTQGRLGPITCKVDAYNHTVEACTPHYSILPTSWKTEWLLSVHYCISGHMQRPQQLLLARNASKPHSSWGQEIQEKATLWNVPKSQHFWRSWCTARKTWLTSMWSTESWTPGQTRMEIGSFWGRSPLEVAWKVIQLESSHTSNPWTTTQLASNLAWSTSSSCWFMPHLGNNETFTGSPAETSSLSSSHRPLYSFPVPFFFLLISTLFTAPGTRTLPGMPHASRSQWHGANLKASEHSRSQRTDHKGIIQSWPGEKKTNSETCVPELCTANPATLCDQTLHGPLPLPWHG